MFLDLFNTFLLYAVFILFPELENLELLYPTSIQSNLLVTSDVSLYSAHMKLLIISQTSQVPVRTLCFCTCCYLQGSIVLSVCPTFLILRVLSQMSPSILSNTLPWAPVAILSFLWYSGILICLFTGLSDTGDYEILQNKEHLLYIFISQSGCGMCIVKSKYSINVEWMNVRINKKQMDI